MTADLEQVRRDALRRSLVAALNGHSCSHETAGAILARWDALEQAERRISELEAKLAESRRMYAIRREQAESVPALVDDAIQLCDQHISDEQRKETQLRIIEWSSVWERDAEYLYQVREAIWNHVGLRSEHVVAFDRLRGRAEQAERVAESVPVLVEALASDAHSEMSTVAGLLRLGGFDAAVLADRLAAACERARAALTVYEQSQGEGDDGKYGDRRDDPSQGWLGP